MIVRDAPMDKLQGDSQMNVNKLLTSTATAALIGFGIAVMPAAMGGADVVADTAANAIDSNALIGQNIVNANGDTIGEVEGVVIDKDGTIRHVIAGVGGFLGLGEKHVALKWDELAITENGQRVVANVTKEQLEALPDHKFPESAKPGTVYSYDDDVRTNPYLSDGGIADAPAQSADSTTATSGATEAAIEPAAGMPGLRATEVIGATVKNPDGESIGEISEMIVETDGSINGVVVDVGGFLGVGEHPVLLGWEDLRITGPADDLSASTSLNKEQLNALPPYKDPM
jgi:sporulation protein YlmC with PRC-barrel domain